MSFISLYFSLFAVAPCTFALEIDTHEVINMAISDNVSHDGFALGPYLSNVLLLEKGTFEIVDGNRITKLLGLGGKYEDGSPGCQQYDRSRNHFHNPLTETGFSGLFFGFLGGISAVNWAQLPDNVQQTKLVLSCPGDSYSWSDVRNYFFQGLTSQNNDVRGTNLAKAFRGIGQLMHLVEDMSVPQHVRDDFHVLYNYEKWVNQYRQDPFLIFYLDNPVFPDDSILRRTSAFDNASVPIANLFDTNQYDGTDPNVTLRTDIGLAEFTNANFFSDDTIFSRFPFPSWSQVEEYEENVAGENRIYLRKLKDVGGQPVEHIAHYLGTRWMYKYSPPIIKQLLLKLDGRVYADYARELIPRAVGYSFQLMKYFFRGALEVSRPDENVYSVIDGSVSQSFRKIKARVRNNTPSEEAGSGTLHAVAKYKIRSDYLPDLSHDPPNQPLPDVNYSYSVSAPVTIDNSVEALRLKADNPNSYLFDFSASPIPAGITDLTLMIVFKGTLGYESDSAIAVGSNDLMEPAHHVYFNLTDMFAINGHLWTAQQIRDNTSLLSQAGTAYIDPFPMSVAVSYVNQAPPMPITNPEIDIAVANLSPGYHFELIVLVDNNNYIRVTEADDIDPGIDTRYTGYIGFRNQSYGGAWTSTPGQLLLFRHDAAGNPVRTNFYTGWLRCTPYEGGYCPYPENEATVPLPDLSPVPVQILGDFDL
jgi:hypothetical protein